jgi:hypothetical protein
MKISRIIVGTQFVILSALVLGLLGQVRHDIQWSALGEQYREAAKVADVDFPFTVHLFWPFAPVAWWSWITAIACGVFVAARLRRPLNLSTLIISSLGTALFVAVVGSVVLTYSKLFQYMGYPPDVPIDMPSMIANLALLAIAVGFAVRATIQQQAEQGGDGDAEEAV